MPSSSLIPPSTCARRPLRAAARGARDAETVFSDDPGGDGPRAGQARGARAAARRGSRRRLRGRAARRPTLVRAMIAAVRHPGAGGRRAARRSRAVEAVLEAGARWAVVGTRAALDPAFLGEVCRRLPRRRSSSAVDACDGRVAVEGWTRVLGPRRHSTLAPRCARAAGAAALLYTDVSRDGTEQRAQRRSTEALARGGGHSRARLRRRRLARRHPAARGGARRGRASSWAARSTRARWTLPDAALAAVRLEAMLRKRIIPCLDVQGRPRGEGRALRRSARRRRSGRGRAGLRRPGRRRARVPRHHRLARGPRHHARRGAAHGRGHLHAAHGGRRRSASLEDIRTLLRAGADKVSLNTAALARPGAHPRGGASASAASASWSPSTRAASRRRTGRAGASTPTAAAGPPGATRWSGRARWSALGAGEILLTSMDRDGTNDGYDLELTRAVAEAVSVPVIASGGAGSLEHLREGARRGRRGRRAGGLALPLRPAHDRGGQGAIWRERGVAVRLEA